MKRKLISALALCMLINSVPVSSFANDSPTETIEVSANQELDSDSQETQSESGSGDELFDEDGAEDVEDYSKTNEDDLNEGDDIPSNEETEQDDKLGLNEESSELSLRDEVLTSSIESNLSDDRSEDESEEVDINGNKAESLEIMLKQFYPSMNPDDIEELVNYYKTYLDEGNDDDHGKMMSLFSNIRAASGYMGWESKTDMANSPVSIGILRYTVQTEGKMFYREMSNDEKTLFNEKITLALSIIELEAQFDDEGINFTSTYNSFSYRLNFQAENQLDPMIENQANSFKCILEVAFPKMNLTDIEAFTKYYKTYLYKGNESKFMPLFTAIKDLSATMERPLTLDSANSNMADGLFVYTAQSEGILYYKDLSDNVQNELRAKIISTANIIGLEAEEVEKGISFKNEALGFNHTYNFLTEETSGENNGGNTGGNTGGNSGGSSGGENVDHEQINTLINTLDAYLTAYFPAMSSSDISEFKSYAKTYLEDNGISGIMITFVKLKTACIAMGWDVSPGSSVTDAPTISGSGKKYYNSLTDEQKSNFQTAVEEAGKAMGLDVVFDNGAVSFRNSAKGFSKTIVFKTGGQIISDTLESDSLAQKNLLESIDKKEAIALYTGFANIYMSNFIQKDKDILIKYIESHSEKIEDKIKLFDFFSLMARANALRDVKTSLNIADLKDKENLKLYKSLKEEDKDKLKQKLHLMAMMTGLTYIEDEKDSSFITLSSIENWSVSFGIHNIYMTSSYTFEKSGEWKALKDMEKEDLEEYKEQITKAFAVLGTADLTNNTINLMGNDINMSVDLEKDFSELKQEVPEAALTANESIAEKKPAVSTIKEINGLKPVIKEAAEQSKEEIKEETKEQDIIEPEVKKTVSKIKDINGLKAVIKEEITVSENAKTEVKPNTQQEYEQTINMIQASPELNINIDGNILNISSSGLEKDQTMDIKGALDVSKTFNIKSINDALSSKENTIKISLREAKSPIVFNFIMSAPEINLKNSEGFKFTQKIVPSKYVEKPAIEEATAIDGAVNTGIKPEVKPEALSVYHTKNYQYKNAAVIEFFGSLLDKYFPGLKEEDKNAIKIYVDKYENKSQLGSAYSNMRMACEAMGFTVDTDFSNMASGKVDINVHNDGQKYYKDLTAKQKEDLQYFVSKIARNIGLQYEFSEESLLLSNEDYEFEWVIDFKK